MCKLYPKKVNSSTSKTPGKPIIPHISHKREKLKMGAHLFLKEISSLKVQKDLKKVARERARSKGRQSTWAEKLHCINHKALIKSGLTIYDRTSLLKRVKLTARGEQK